MSTQGQIGYLTRLLAAMRQPQTGSPTPATDEDLISVNVQPYDQDLTAIATLSGTSGLLRKTGLNTWTLDNSNYLTTVTNSQVTTALGYTPVTDARTLTINGVTYDLTANRSWTIAGGVTSFNTRTGAITLLSSDITSTIGYTPENAANKGIANGYASLDGSGLVPSTQLPSYVDDVLEYTNVAAFPATGTAGKIYVALDSNKVYRWSGSTYIEVSPTVGTIWGGITGTLSNQTDLQSALDAKVPTSRTITINGISYDLTANRSWSAIPAGGLEGQILAKSNDSDYNVAWIDNYAEQTKHDVKLGEAMSAGTAVYVTINGNGTNMTVLKASYAAEATSSKTLGIIQTGGILNDIVKVVTEGLLSGINTSTATAGDPVWLGSNGALLFGLANKPVAPNHLVYLGVVTRVHAQNGEIFVHVQNGFELDELHDISIVSKANNQGIFYESSTGLWKNKSIATVLGYTPYDASNPAGYITSAALSSYVPTSRTITINGTAYDLSADRSWSITSMIYPGAGIAVSTGTAWGTSITDNSANWNTAYSWGNHASAGYLLSSTASSTYLTISTAASTYLTSASASSTYLTSANAASTYLTISNAASSYQPLDGDLTAIAGLAGTSGFLKKTAANTWSLDTNTYLTSYTETDPIYVASSWYTTTNNSANWNTAYGWGNHASAGYLTTSLAASTYQPLDGDLTAIAGLAGTSGFLKKTAANTWSLDTNSYLTSFTETDPFRVTAVAVSGTNTKTITITRADASTVSTTWTDYDTDTNTYVTSAAFSAGTLTLTRNDTGTVSVSLDGRYYLATNPSGYTTNTGTVTSVSLSVPTGLSISGSPITTSGTLAVTFTAGYSIPTTASQTNWDTAYGWGNHASAGYLTTSTAASTYQPLDADLTAIAGLAGTSGFLKKTAANTWTLDTNTYLTSYTETDPVYVASTWYSTTNNSTNWNTAYGWGNHASAGYLTGITSGQVTTALGYTPVTNARTLTINGTAYDLTADRSWTISAGTTLNGTGFVKASGTTITYDNSTYYLASNPSGYTSNTGTVTSVGGTGTVSGLTLSGTVTSTGNLTLSGTLSATIDNISDEHRLFNNMGNNHSTYTDANSVGNFGFRYLQGNTNGPNTGATQYYGMTIGLGNEYAYGTYASQLYWNRTPTGGNPYVSVRFQEAGSWGSWSKIYAGYADSAGSAGTSSQVTVNYNNDSNSTYQMLWGSGNSVYGTGGIYCNPASDTVYATTFIENSSVRFKENIVGLEGSLDKVVQMRGVKYNKKGTNYDQVGVIAEEVLDILPEVVNYAPDGAVEGVAYARLTAVLIEAVKEQQKQIDELKNLLNSK